MESQLDHYLGLISDNPWYQAGTVLLAGLVLAKIINFIISKVVLRLTRHTASIIDDQVVIALRPALFYSVQLIALALALDLVLPDHGYWPSRILKTLAVGLWMVFLIRLINIVLRNESREARTPWINTQTLPLFENTGIILAVGAALYAVFSIWGIDMTAWLASAGIVGIAVGFAAKDTLANLFSGVLIMADAPYKIGDYIVLDSGERGEVTRIGLRSTRILTRDDVEVTVPNAIMVNTKIINESGGPYKKYRIRIKVGIAYGSDIDKAKQVLMEEATGNPEVCSDPEPRVRFRQFGASSLDLELLCWIDEPAHRGKVSDILNTNIYKRFRVEKIEIPYSKQDIFIKEMPGQKS